MAPRTNRTEKLAAKRTLRLADRREFRLSGKGWDAFVAALDAPPRRHPRLERLFREPSVFDSEKYSIG
jgi:uncharacterized protein (DUF1778 family)